jgi:excisionase family DNA binding protein
MFLEQIIQKKKGALRANDIAEILDLSEKQIYKLAAAGKIPSLKIENSVRFDPQDLADWLKSRSSGSSFAIGSQAPAMGAPGRGGPRLRRSSRI